MNRGWKIGAVAMAAALISAVAWLAVALAGANSARAADSASSQRSFVPVTPQATQPNNPTAG